MDETNVWNEILNLKNAEIELYLKKCRKIEQDGLKASRMRQDVRSVNGNR